MIAVLVGDHDQACGRQRGLNEVISILPIWLGPAESVETVNGLVHAGVDHDGAVRVDHLKGRARGNEGFIAAAVDYRRVGPMALSELQVVDRLGQGTGHGGGCAANLLQQIVRIVRVLTMERRRRANRRCKESCSKPIHFVDAGSRYRQLAAALNAALRSA